MQGEPGGGAWSVADPGGAQVLSSLLAAGERASFDSSLSGPPALWWPNRTANAGCLRLRTIGGARRAGEVVDRRSIPFGVRQVMPVLNDPASGEKRFAFESNGQLIFLRGACWSLLEGITHVWDEARATRLLDLFEQGSMNVLRSTSGRGHYPAARFL